MANRSNFGDSYSSSHNGTSSNNNYTSRSESSPNDFMRLSQVVSNNIQKITQNVTQLNSWLSQYGTRQDTPELRDKVHDMQHYTNQLAKDTGKYTKDLSQIQLPSNPSEMRQQKLQRERLVSEFTTALNNFQIVQRQEKEKERASVTQARSSIGSSAKVSYDPFADSTPGGFQYNSSEMDDGFGFSKQTTLQMDANDIDLELVREREEALHKLEKDIVDVNQIFKDLGALVHEQGDVIDSIEANVESAGVSVEQGTEQLRQARDYQSKSRKKKCILLIICLVILAIIAIILGVTLAPHN